MACIFVCDSCGKQAPGDWYADSIWRKPPDWYDRLVGEESDLKHACCYACLVQVAAANGTTLD